MSVVKQHQPYPKEFPLFTTEGNVFMHIDQGFVPGMRVPAVCIISQSMRELLVGELRQNRGKYFTPALKQVANVAGLPGIVRRAILLPDGHAGYGFAVGSCCATRASDPEAVISPGGIGFDINCGVRVLRTNLNERDLTPDFKEKLAQSIFDHVPVGVGSQGILPTTNEAFLDTLNHGMDFSVREGYAWPEDKEHCEEFGRMLTADVKEVSTRAIRRGMPAISSLGGGNHYLEIQSVDKIYDTFAARRMGIEEEGQIVAMIHTGSRGFGHQVATDALVVMERHMKAEGIDVNDPQLACARINSATGQSYLKAMACAANFAWANRSAIAFLLRQALVKCLGTGETADDLDMHTVYDVAHNIAKFEEHFVSRAEGGNDRPETLLLHRKGSTRAFPPFHPLIPSDYQACGQPVLIGGSMGTSSHILTGTEKGMETTFGTCCHGAGRNHSRAAQRREIDYTDVLADLRAQNIAVRVASPHLLMEEAPSSYKDVDEVVDVCSKAGITNKAVRMKPLVVVKG